MVVKEVTPKQPPSHKRKRRSSNKQSKVVLREFKQVKAVSLAKLGRKIYRFHACIDHAFPDDPTLHYPHVYNHIATLQDTSMAEALKRVGENDELRRHLVGFVRFFSSSNFYLDRWWSTDVLRNRSATLWLRYYYTSENPGLLWNSWQEVSSWSCEFYLILFLAVSNVQQQRELVKWLEDRNRFHERKLDLAVCLIYYVLSSINSLTLPPEQTRPFSYPAIWLWLASSNLAEPSDWPKNRPRPSLIPTYYD